MQPALHKGRILNSNAIAKWGTMWPTKGVGKPGTMTSQVWVDFTWRPSGRFTVKGWDARRRFGTGTPSFTNTEVAPLSAIPCESSMSIVMFCGAKPASCVGNETLDVATVASTLTSVVQFNNNWVEFRGAETKSLNLCAVNTSAPPRHMGAGNGPIGNCVLCCPLVHKFSRVYPT